ncbi:MAG: cytochrome C oxidase subunit IV family protein [Bacteroidetes bacterium]|nr:cytochrome C oxidase subunit IV family protein [Bacteroidota bacterium]
MENVHSTTVADHGGEHNFDTKLIWRTFRILLIITVIELILAIGYYKMENSFGDHRELAKHVLNGVFIILTLAKAFYIVAEFMHLGHEIKNLIMTIAVPALLFLWFIGAFLWDGNSYKTLRNRYDEYHLKSSQEKVPAAEHGHEQKPGTME